MNTVASRDGTSIAVDHVGDGPPVVIVVGAFNDRRTGGPLAAALASQFTVHTYDRRGRGDSGDTAPYAIEREIEDLEAVIAAAGGPAGVFGYSSGAALALHAAAHGLPITRLAVYDAPVGTETRWSVDHAAELARLVDAGRRGDAVEYFQSRLVGMPDAVVAQLRHAPFRPALEAMARTLVYEAALVGDGSLPAGLARSISVPTLVVAGAAGSPVLLEAAEALAVALPNAGGLALEGQGHDLDAQVVGPLLARFFAGSPADRSGAARPLARASA